MSNLSLGIRQASSAASRLNRLVDAAVIAGISYLATMLTPAGGDAGYTLVNEWIGVTAAALVAFHALSEVTGVYRSWRGARLRGELGCLVLNWGYTIAALLGLGLVTGYNIRFTYETKITWIALTPLMLVLTRLVMRTIQRRLQLEGWNTKKVAICGCNELGLQLAKNLKETPELGLSIHGFYEDRHTERRKNTKSVDKDRRQSNHDKKTNSRRSNARKFDPPAEIGSVVGGINQLVEAAKSGEVDTIYLTFPMRAEERLRKVLNRLSDTTADVYIVPDFFVFELLHARLTNVGGLPAVSIHENPLYGIDGLLKRVADVGLSTLMLVVLAIPMLMIALAVKLTSRGPVFFRQKRYGLDGEEILVWKFRSMKTEQCQSGEAGTVVKQATKDDPRITKIGGFLRRTSLDELPQLFNVIGGSMSLVGPRPHASAHNEEYRSLIDGYMLRHKVKPGITGLAQVKGFRGETDTLDKMEGRVHYDHEYIRTWSFTLDMEILFQTFFVVFGHKNAY